MTATTTEHIDVLVVGAGPTGLMLAGDLLQAGVRVTVLERGAQESNVTRAFAVRARTLEELQIRGVAAELAATGTAIRGLRLYGRATIDLTRLPSAFPSLLITPQYQTEGVLARRLDRLGVAITRDAEVVGLTQDTEGVDVRVRGSDGAERRYRAAYAVGADGVRSAVRTALGLPYPGRSVVRSLMLADVRFLRPGETFWEPGGDRIHYQAANPGAVWTRFIAIMAARPGERMLTLVEPAELEARRTRRHPGSSATKR